MKLLNKVFEGQLITKILVSIIIISAVYSLLKLTLDLLLNIDKNI